MKTHRARTTVAHEHNNNVAEDIPANPLLSSQEAEEKRRQEIVSSFLTGLVLGGLCIGGVWLAFKWFKPCASVLEEAVEEAMKSA